MTKENFDRRQSIRGREIQLQDAFAEIDVALTVTDLRLIKSKCRLAKAAIKSVLANLAKDRAALK